VENAHPRNALAPVGGGGQDRAKRQGERRRPRFEAKSELDYFAIFAEAALNFSTHGVATVSFSFFVSA